MENRRVEEMNGINNTSNISSDHWITAEIILTKTDSRIS